MIELVDDCRGFASELLIASPRGIFGLESNFALARVPLNYYAIGSGEELALGSMFCSRKMGDPSVVAVETAVEAATKFSKSCGFDVHIKCYEVEK